AIFGAILHEAPISPLQLSPDLPAKMEEIIEKALEKDRDLRYQSAAEIRTDLKRLHRDTTSGRSLSAPSARPGTTADHRRSQRGGQGTMVRAHPSLLSRRWLIVPAL